jgi:hypothetical protein
MVVPLPFPLLPQVMASRYQVLTAIAPLELRLELSVAVRLFAENR